MWWSGWTLALSTYIGTSNGALGGGSIADHPAGKVVGEGPQSDAHVVPWNGYLAAGAAVIESRSSRPRQEVPEHGDVQIKDVVVGRGRPGRLDRPPEHPLAPLHFAGREKNLDRRVVVENAGARFQRLRSTPLARHRSARGSSALERLAEHFFADLVPLDA